MFEALFDPTGTAFISDSTWLHETVFFSGIECQRLGLLNQDSSCNIMNYQPVRELPKIVQLCPTF